MINIRTMASHTRTSSTGKSSSGVLPLHLMAICRHIYNLSISPIWNSRGHLQYKDQFINMVSHFSLKVKLQNKFRIKYVNKNPNLQITSNIRRTATKNTTQPLCLQHVDEELPKNVICHFWRIKNKISRSQSWIYALKHNFKGDRLCMDLV